MKTLSSLMLLSGLCATNFCFGASGSYQCSGSIRTVDKDKGEKIDRPRGSIRESVEEKVLKVSVRRTNPNAAQMVRVQWVVALERENGKIELATRGERWMDCAVGIPVELVSEPFTLTEVSFNGNARTRDASREQKVKGFGIRVIDSSGAELGAAFQPSSQKELIRKGFPPIEVQAEEPQQPKKDPAERKRPRRNPKKTLPRRLR